MDLPRTTVNRKPRALKLALGGIAIALLAATVLAARLKPAAPEVEREVVWIDTVKRGPMLRSVRGLGTLVPEDIRWIAARSEARVDKIVLRPGASVQPDDVVLVLSNPQLEQDAAAAASKLQAAEAELVNLRVQLQSKVLSAESTSAAAAADFQKARMKAEVHDRGFERGVVPELDRNLSRIAAEQAQIRSDIEKKRFAFARDSVAPQVAVKAAELDRMRAEAQLAQDELASLQVRAGSSGVVQQLSVEAGAGVTPGTNLARIADPTRLKAQVRIPESQARDVQIGQPATVDTHNGVAKGTVTRVDPAVQEGTVLVDIGFSSALPRGARPDLSIEGTIELERLSDVITMKRPVFGQERSTVGIFKLDSAGRSAARVPVQLGRGSVDTVEIVGGLEPGDRVILSDMSQWDSNDSIRLK